MMFRFGIQKFRAVWVLILIMSGILISVNGNELEEVSSEELGAFFDGLVPALMQESHIAGVSLSVVRADELLFMKGYGYKNIEENTLVDPVNTSFRIGSVTKLFVWTALLQLYENGKLDLDEPVQNYIDFSLDNPYKTPVTINHLMTHTAGFEDRGFGLWAPAADSVTPLGDWLKDHKPSIIREPGVESSYSNYGAALAGYIVERISGLSFEEYCRVYIFQPLGMLHVSLQQPLDESEFELLSEGYSYSEGWFYPQPFEILRIPPAGAATATSADLALFMKALLSSEQDILKPETKKLFLSRQTIHDSLLSNGMASGLYETSEHGLRIVGHGGDTMLFHSRMVLIPQEDFGLFITCNSADGEELGTQVVSALLDAFCPVETPILPTVIPKLAEQKTFTGNYQMNRRSYTTAEKLFQLFGYISVTAEPSGAVLLNGPKGIERYIPVKVDGLYQKIGDDEKILFTEKHGIKKLYIDSVPVLVFDKVPWYAERLFTLGFLLCSSVVYAGWMLHVIRSRRRSMVYSLWVKSIRNLYSVVAVLFFLIIILLIISLSNFQALVMGDNSFLQVVLVLPYVIGVFGFFAIFVSGFTCSKRKNREMIQTKEIVWWSLLSVVTILLLLWMSYWRLLGGAAL